jgi:hypothetical protein
MSALRGSEQLFLLRVWNPTASSLTSAISSVFCVDADAQRRVHLPIG